MSIHDNAIKVAGDAVAAEIRRHVIPEYRFGARGLGATEHDLAKVAVAAYQETLVVESEAQLHDLPDMAVIIDKFGDVLQSRGGWWCGYESAELDHHQMAKYLPAKIIHLPSGDHLGTCLWFATCPNPATSTRPHPSLGDVPICDRCDALCANLNQEKEKP